MYKERRRYNKKLIMGRSLLRSLIKDLNLPLDEDRQTGWKPYPLFSGATFFMDHFSCHISVLSPGIMPHQPHAHAEEELLIMLSGEADLVLPGKISDVHEERIRIYPGNFVFYPPFNHHTIHNVGSVPATYLMFKWDNVSAAGASKPAEPLEAKLFCYDRSTIDIGSKLAQGIAYQEVLNGPTIYLSKLQSHMTALQTGAGYQPHGDAYDVAILLLSGTIETLGQAVRAHSVIFYAADEPHGIINIGDCDAFYLVFEFHGDVNSLPEHNEHSEVLMAQRTKITELEEAISELNAKNDVLEAKLQDMEHSITWQIVGTFHSVIVERCFPQGSRLRNGYDLAIHAGRLLINEGSNAFWQDCRNNFKKN